MWKSGRLSLIYSDFYFMFATHLSCKRFSVSQQEEEGESAEVTILALDCCKVLMCVTVL